MILGRNEQKVNNVLSEVLERNPTISTKSFIFDLNNSQDNSYFIDLKNFIEEEKMDVSMLINNAGI